MTVLGVQPILVPSSEVVVIAFARCTRVATAWDCIRLPNIARVEGSHEVRSLSMRRRPFSIPDINTNWLWLEQLACHSLIIVYKRSMVRHCVFNYSKTEACVFWLIHYMNQRLKIISTKMFFYLGHKGDVVMLCFLYQMRLICVS